MEHWRLYHQFRPYTDDKKINTTRFEIIIAGIYVATIILISIIK